MKTVSYKEKVAAIYAHERSNTYPIPNILPLTASLIGIAAFKSAASLRNLLDVSIKHNIPIAKYSV